MRDKNLHQPTEGVVYEILGVIKLNSKNDLVYDELKNCHPKHCHTVTLNNGIVVTSTGHTHKQSLFNLRKQIITILGESLTIPATKDIATYKARERAAQTPLTAYYHASQQGGG